MDPFPVSTNHQQGTFSRQLEGNDEAHGSLVGLPSEIFMACSRLLRHCEEPGLMLRTLK